LLKGKIRIFYAWPGTSSTGARPGRSATSFNKRTD
jgi:hypothetical protein